MMRRTQKKSSQLNQMNPSHLPLYGRNFATRQGDGDPSKRQKSQMKA
jgi:hypothetical protein